MSAGINAFTPAHDALCWLFMASVRTTATEGQKAITGQNPAFREYYEKKLGEGKNGQQALICISRRLINIIYGMLKNGTEYRMPKQRNCDEKKYEKG